MDNGNSASNNGDVKATAVDTIILTYDRAADHLNVGGKANSLHLMLDMLGRATRVVEDMYRLEKAREVRAQLLRDAQDAAIAASLRKGG